MSSTHFDCETVRRLLPERGELTGGVRHGLEEHLSSCAACAAEAAQLALVEKSGLALAEEPGDETLQDALARAVPVLRSSSATEGGRFELSPWFQEKLHRDIMAAVDSSRQPHAAAERSPHFTLGVAGSVAEAVQRWLLPASWPVLRSSSATEGGQAGSPLALRPAPLAWGAAAIFSVFLLAILFFLWNPIPLNKHAPEAALLPEQAAARLLEGEIPLKAGMENAEPPAGRALALRKVSGEEKTAALSEGEAALPEKVGVTVRFERDATVLEWAGPRDALYRVTRSFGPDFETASYLEFVEVGGPRYRDLDARPGMRFYRVERIG